MCGQNYTQKQLLLCLSFVQCDLTEFNLSNWLLIIKYLYHILNPIFANRKKMMLENNMWIDILRIFM